MYKQSHNKRQNGTTREQSASCIRIKERPYPTRIRKSFIEEVAFELSFEVWIEFSWVMKKEEGLRGREHSENGEWAVYPTPFSFTPKTVFFPSYLFITNLIML